MSFVVSANYKNFTKTNWLVRKESQSIEECQEKEVVVATDFVLERPEDGEEGFGCRAVAVCKSVLSDMSPQEFEALRKDLIKIKFNGYNAFYEEESTLPVKAGKYLLLDKDGMYYMPVGQQAA